MKLETHYGKAEVSTYRTNATPLTGVRQIPESTFTGRPNILLAASIDVQVMGDVFTAGVHRRRQLRRSWPRTP